MEDATSTPQGLSLPVRLVLLALGFILAVSLIVVWAAGFLRTSPPMVTARTVSTSSGKQAYITMQTVGAIGYGARPTWVSYLMQDQSGKWVHTTKFQVPANATIHVTVDEYDGQGALRNPLWSRIQGTVGGVEKVTGLLGTKKVTDDVVSQMGPSDAAHSFAIPALGLYVPLAGVSNNDTLCPEAPCNLKQPHNIIQFSFKTKSAGILRWQCFVPCGLNFLDGNGGPMQTIGYMQGFMKVVA